ncbi:MAG: hypothetical protein ACM3ML_10790 [Micromonosporaceae bacterium]
MSHGAIWRVLLAIGAIPGLAVYYMRRQIHYMRRQIHETPRFAIAGGAEDMARAAVAAATGEEMTKPAGDSSVRHSQSWHEGFLLLVRNRRMLAWLIGTAGCWMLLDFAYYGNTISSPEILKLINSRGTLLHNTLLQLAIFVVFALPGYKLAIALLDRSGRKGIQIGAYLFPGMLASSSDRPE